MERGLKHSLQLINKQMATSVDRKAFYLPCHLTEVKGNWKHWPKSQFSCSDQFVVSSLLSPSVSVYTLHCIACMHAYLPYLHQISTTVLHSKEKKGEKTLKAQCSFFLLFRFAITCKRSSWGIPWRHAKTTCRIFSNRLEMKAVKHA